jgi:hypothetical protein
MRDGLREAPVAALSQAVLRWRGAPSVHGSEGLAMVVR